MLHRGIIVISMIIMIIIVAVIIIIIIIIVIIINYYYHYHRRRQRHFHHRDHHHYRHHQHHARHHLFFFPHFFPATVFSSHCVLLFFVQAQEEFRAQVCFGKGGGVDWRRGVCHGFRKHFASVVRREGWLGRGSWLHGPTLVQWERLPSFVGVLVLAFLSFFIWSS